MKHPTSLRTAATLAALAAVAVPGDAGATALPVRTLRVSVAADGTQADGPSSQALLSGSGRVLAFRSQATNIGVPDANGPVDDVFALDLVTNEHRLVSQSIDADGADGPSSSPVLSYDGRRVVFVSAADDLVADDTNGVPDVFMRDANGPVTRLSVAADGAEADGASSEPDLTPDGRYVVFTSSATNLVPDDTNGRPDVFVRDLQAGTIERVSVGPDGKQADGRSSGPAISADGSTVAFESGAADLVTGDRNGVSDVFVRDLRRKNTERVSVSSTGREQDKSVAPGFLQVADLSRDGRFVVFDSDATELTRQDRNQRTDVFLRDRRQRTTQLISASSLQVQGDNDSFAPRITPNGRYVTFQSFATNLAVGDGPREDVFVRDLRQATTSVVNVTADGSPRLGELVPQLLQRPSLSADGLIAAFSSTVPNLVGGDDNGAEDVFLRFLEAPVGRVVAKPRANRPGTVRIGVDDRAATSFVCRFDDRDPFACGRKIAVRQGQGRALRVRVGGTGMLFNDDELVVPLTDDQAGPAVRIRGLSAERRNLGPRLRVVRGTATDRSGVARVEVSLTYLGPGGCRTLTADRRFVKTSCTAQRFVRAAGGQKWSLRLPRSIIGPVAIHARAIDRLGNRGRTVTLKGLAL